MELLIPVIASMIWSLNPAVIYRFARGTPPFLFTSLRALLALLVVGVLMLLSGMNLHGLPSLIMLLIVLSGVLGPGVGDVAYTRSIQLLGGSLAVVISYTYIFLAQAFSVLMLHEVLSYKAIAGSILAFTGVIVASFSNGLGKVNKKGILHAFSAAICWGLATALIKAVEGYVDVLSLAFIRLISVALFTFFMSITVGEKTSICGHALIAVAFTGILGWGIGMVLFIQAIYSLGVSVAVIATAFTPILSQFTGKFIGGEKLSARTFIGALLVTLGILLQIVRQ
ncbi:MAG: DMT family transporter [Desulfurococcaceae archaeon]